MPWLDDPLQHFAGPSERINDLDCRATIKVRTPDNQDEKVIAWLVPQEGRSPTVGAGHAMTCGEILFGEPTVI